MELGSRGASVSWTMPSASDNSGDVVSLSSHEPGDIFPAGLTNVTYHFEDDSGNMAECNFTVLVEYGKYNVMYLYTHIFMMYILTRKCDVNRFPSCRSVSSFPRQGVRIS